MEKPPPDSSRGGGVENPPATSHRNWHLPAMRGLPGFHRASPSTPLDVSSYVRGTLAGLRRRKAQVDCGCRAELDADDDADRRRAAAVPMPNLPKPASARGAVTRRGRTRPPSLSAPNVEVVEASRRQTLRWINIERPRQVDRAWLEEHFDFHAARLRGRLLAQPAPEGRRVRRLPLRRPALPGLRQARRPPERRRGRRLRRARLRHHAAQRADQPLEYLFERCRTREDVRE